MTACSTSDSGTDIISSPATPSIIETERDTVDQVQDTTESEARKRNVLKIGIVESEFCQMEMILIRGFILI